jgi:hypothetical protein
MIRVSNVGLAEMMAARRRLGKKKCAPTVPIHGLRRAITARRIRAVSDLVSSAAAM